MTHLTCKECGEEIYPADNAEARLFLLKHLHPEAHIEEDD